MSLSVIVINWTDLGDHISDGRQLVYHTDHPTLSTARCRRAGSSVRSIKLTCVLYGHYLPTVILTIIWYSFTHSLFHSRLKTFLFCKSLPPEPFLLLLRDSLHGLPRLFTVISEHMCFILFSFSVFTLVVGSVR